MHPRFGNGCCGDDPEILWRFNSVPARRTPMAPFASLANDNANLLSEAEERKHYTLSTSTWPADSQPESCYRNNGCQFSSRWMGSLDISGRSVRIRNLPSRATSYCWRFVAWLMRV